MSSESWVMRKCRNSSQQFAMKIWILLEAGMLIILKWIEIAPHSLANRQLNFKWVFLGCDIFCYLLKLFLLKKRPRPCKKRKVHFIKRSNNLQSSYSECRNRILKICPCLLSYFTLEKIKTIYIFWTISITICYYSQM